MRSHARSPDHHGRGRGLAPVRVRPQRLPPGSGNGRFTRALRWSSVCVLQRRGERSGRAHPLRAQPRQRPAALARAQRCSARAHFHRRHHRRARSVHPALARQPSLLPDRHRSKDARQRQLGSRAASREPIDRRLGIHRSGGVGRATPGARGACRRRQHVGARGDLRPITLEVRGVLGVDPLRGRRRGSCRQLVQPDAVRDDHRLSQLQPARGVERSGPRRDRLDGDRSGRQLLSLHEGRARERPG